MKFSISLYILVLLTVILATIVYFGNFSSEYVAMSDNSNIKNHLEIVAAALAIVLLILQIFKEIRDLRK